MILTFIMPQALELCTGSHINDTLGSMPESSLLGYCGVLCLTYQLIFHLPVHQPWCLILSVGKLGQISGLPGFWVVLYLRALAPTESFSRVV